LIDHLASHHENARLLAEAVNDAPGLQTNRHHDLAAD
jgi:hypothetical protein